MNILDSFFTASATTDGVTVRVAPNFLDEQSVPAQGRWFWSYHIRIENHGDEPVQLLTRHWKITDAQGLTQEVRGAGVIGEQPLLNPGEAYRYTSGTALHTASGLMLGEYEMVNPTSGEHFEVIKKCYSRKRRLSTASRPYILANSQIMDVEQQKIRFSHWSVLVLLLHSGWLSRTDGYWCL